MSEDLDSHAMATGATLSSDPLPERGVSPPSRGGTAPAAALLVPAAPPLAAARASAESSAPEAAAEQSQHSARRPPTPEKQEVSAAAVPPPDGAGQVLQRKGRFTLLKPAAPGAAAPSTVSAPPPATSGAVPAGNAMAPVAPGTSSTPATGPVTAATAFSTAAAPSAAAASSTSAAPSAASVAAPPNVSTAAPSASPPAASGDSTVVTRKGRFTLVQDATPPPPPAPLPAPPQQQVQQQPPPPPPLPASLSRPIASVPTTIHATMTHERSSSQVSAAGSLASSLTIPASEFPPTSPPPVAVAAATAPPPPPAVATKKLGRFVVSAAAAAPEPSCAVAPASVPDGASVVGVEAAVEDGGFAPHLPPAPPPPAGATVVESVSASAVPTATVPPMPVQREGHRSRGKPAAPAEESARSGPHALDGTTGWTYYAYATTTLPPCTASAPEATPPSSVMPPAATEPARPPPGAAAQASHPADRPTNGAAALKKASSGPRNAAVGHVGRAAGAGKMFYFLDQLRLEAMDADRTIRTLQTDVRMLRDRNKELEAKARDVERKLHEERALREAAEAKLKVAKKRLRELMRAAEAPDSLQHTDQTRTVVAPQSSSCAVDVDGLVLTDSLSGECRDDGTFKRRPSNDPGTASAHDLDPGSKATSPAVSRRAGASMTPPRSLSANRGSEPDSPVTSTSTTPVHAHKSSPIAGHGIATAATEPGRSSAGSSPRNGQHPIRLAPTPHKLPPLPSNTSPPGTIGSGSAPWTGTGTASQWQSVDRPPLGATSAGGRDRDATLMQLSAAQAEARHESAAMAAAASAARSLASEFDPLRPAAPAEEVPSASASAATAAAAAGGEAPTVPAFVHAPTAPFPATPHECDDSADRRSVAADGAEAAPQHRVPSRSYPEQDWHWQHWNLQQPALGGDGALLSYPQLSSASLFLVPQPGQHPIASQSQSLPAGAPVWVAVQSSLPLPLVPPPPPRDWVAPSALATAPSSHGGQVGALPPSLGAADPFDELVRRSSSTGAALPASVAGGTSSSHGRNGSR